MMKKIDKKNIRDIIALTPMQEGMLYHYLKDPENASYFEQLCLDISGNIDKNRFQQAWDLVTRENEMLRAVFRWDKVEKPIQIILKEHPVQLAYHDFSDSTPESPRQKLQDLKKSLSQSTFSLDSVPFYVTLCKLGDHEFSVIINFHHILYDGWSNGIVLTRFLEIYRALAHTTASQIKLHEKPRFREFVKWLQSRDIDEQKSFWENYLTGHDTRTELPVKRVRTAETTAADTVAYHHIEFPQDFNNKLEPFLSKYRITSAVFFYGAWGLLLQNYCNNDDVVFGCTVSGRTAPIKGIEDMVGLFINTLPLRINTQPGEKVSDMLAALSRNVAQWETVDTTPLPEIMKYSGHDTGDNLFDTIVVMENYPLDSRLKQEKGDISIRSFDIRESTNYDVAIRISANETVSADIVYDPVTCTAETIERMAGFFTNIIDDILEHPESPVHGVRMLTDSDKKQLLIDFNDIGPGFPNDKTLHGLFQEQTQRTPDHIALAGRSSEDTQGGTGDHFLTFRRLDEETDRFARYLIEKGIGPGKVVGLEVRRTIEMMIGIIGILKTGAAYLPLNPDNPPARSKFMLEDSSAVMTVTSKVIREACPLDAPGESQSYAPLDRPPVPAQSLAYIIYTSGSTGRPKGVPISHRNLSPLIHWGYEQLRIDTTDRAAQNLSYYFDWSVWEMFIVITSGAALYMVPETVIPDAAAYVEFIDRNRITVLHITPTHFQTLTHQEKQLTSMVHLCIGAEKLTYDLVKRSYELVTPQCRVYNMYGPTEATIMAAVLELDRDKSAFYKELSSIPIGPTLGNTTLLVLDRNHNPCPVTVSGELFIGGDAVARGYLNNPDLTAEKFVKAHREEKELAHSSKLIARREEKEEKLTGTNEPSFPTSYELPATSFFSFPTSYQLPATSFFYKTGDRCRWLTDGTVEFLGRIDHQVKIRGFRIEPGEIENEILEHPEVKEALVMAREEQGRDSYLCAYVVPVTPGTVPPLKEYLSSRLPEYMVPAYFSFLDAMPLNPNGKVDLKALPEPLALSRGVYTAPRTRVEETLVTIWSRVLDIAPPLIGIDRDFFELGGHSLIITRLAGLVHKELQVELPFTEVFVHPTVRELAAYIGEQEESRYGRIDAVEEKNYYPLSPSQQRLYVLQQMDVNCTVYNIHGVMRLQGEPDTEKFRDAFRALIQRHESLRTSFDVHDAEPVQQVHHTAPFTLDHVEMTPGSAQDSREIAETIARFIRPFDLAHAPLFRVGIAPLGPGDYLFIVDMHHIISDGLSMAVLVNEFMTLYRGKELALPRLQYKDFAHWANMRKNSPALKEQENYWLDKFKGEIPVLNLHTDFARPPVQSFAGAHYDFRIEPGLTHALKELANDHTVTLYSVLSSLFTVLLSKLSGQEEIILGTPVAGRRHADLDSIIGMFVNTLALRHFPAGDLTFAGFLRQVGDQVTKAFENQEYPFEELVDRLAVRRDASRNPLFDVMFAMQNIDLPGIRIPGLHMESYRYDNRIAKFDLVFICETAENDPGLNFTVEYCTHIFKEETIRRFIDGYIKIAGLLTTDPQLPLSAAEIISDHEKQDVLDRFNNYEDHYPHDRAITRLFSEQAERTPHHTAVVGHTSVLPGLPPSPPASGGPLFLTFQYLEHISNILAARLQAMGVTPGSVVGLMTDRSVEMIVAMLGILKTGSAYLPLNPENPLQRTRFMLDDTGASKMICIGDVPAGQEIADSGWTGEVLFIDNLSHFTAPETHASGSLPHVDPGAYAYVIYTSGSTGNPKGVPITHANFCPLVHWGYRHMQLDTTDRAAQNLSYYFDWSVWEIFLVLTSGSSLFMITGDVRLNPSLYAEFIDTNRITVLHVTPTQWQYLIETKAGTRSLKHLCIGAEKLTYDLVKRSYKTVQDDCRVYNMYGPTEATIISAILEIDRDRFESYRHLTSVPIGPPTGNTALYVLDKYSNPCPIGVTGELIVHGQGVAHGYLNNPEFSAERFVSAHSSQLIARREEEKMLTGTNEVSFPTSYELPATSFFYRTGDLCRWLADGTVEFLGRIDHQVKIRGFRIELNEIENCLLRHERVTEAVVITADDDGGEKFICAYIVPGGGKEIPSAELRDHMSEELPEYMIPSYFMFLDGLPLNPNGKVDTRALPKPEFQDKKSYVAPRDHIEKKLAAVWASVLGQGSSLAQSSISIDDNFFELGGHSLKATLMTGKIQRLLHVDIPLTEIFVSPTIRELSRYIREALDEPETPFAALEKAEKSDYYPVSSAQKRLFLLQQMEENSVAYNLPAGVDVTGEIDAATLDTVFNMLIHRHDSFRTSFRVKDDVPVMSVEDDVPFAVTRLTSPSIREFVRPFDLSEAPLLRVGLYTSSPGTHILLIDMHHIIADGLSMGILVREFLALYRDGAAALPDLNLGYSDYAVWQGQPPDPAVLRKQETFWVNHFSGDIPVLQLPIDYQRPLFQDFHGNEIHFDIPSDLTADLHDFCSRKGITPFMALLSIYNILLFKLTGQEDIVVGTPVAGRRHPDLEPIIGLFVNTLPLRNFPKGRLTVKEFVHQVKDHSLEALTHQDYPYEDMVEKIGVERAADRNPLFDTMFSMQNMDIPELEIPGLKLKNHPHENRTAKFDLTLTILEQHQRLKCTLEYSTRLFKPLTVERFARYFQTLVPMVLQNPDKRLSSIQVMSPEERERVVYEFNRIGHVTPLQKPLHRLFEDEAQRHPGRIALVAKDNRGVTYGQLDEMAGQFAQSLKDSGVRTGDIVGLEVFPGFPMMTAILGILKARAAYLPIDPEYPSDRVRFILDDSNARVLVKDAPHGQLPELSIESLHAAPGSFDFPEPGDLDLSLVAYIIYTSGSTGKPKGVVIEHRSILNTLTVLQEAYPCGASDVFLLKTSFTFDVSVAELFGWYLGGGSLAVLDKDDRKNPEEILNAVQAFGVTHANFVPSLFYVFEDILTPSNISKLSSLKYIFLAGEALMPDIVKRFRKFRLPVVIENLYGPTEASIYASMYPLSSWKDAPSIPIGRPLPNVTLYVLDYYRNLQPVGIAGELIIGGAGLARGYLNNPQLTAASFIPSFFVRHFSDGLESGYDMPGSLYQTGDRVRWLDDGNIEFLGRIDHQVKVRGFRVELGEIINRLLTYEHVKEAVVVVKDSNLCAYVVPGEDGFDASEATAHLALELPAYMIPAFFITLEKMPLTASGKIDRPALPAPGDEHGPGGITAPRDALEKALAELWTDILWPGETRDVDIDTGFFVSGGHSLKASLLVSRIQKKLDVKVPLSELFKAPTIRGLAKYISPKVTRATVSHHGIEAAETREYYPLSSAQKRLFVLHRMDDTGTLYNVFSILTLEGTPDNVRLEKAFKGLIGRHQGLRTSFTTINGEPVQHIHPDVPFELETFHIEDPGQCDAVIDKFIRPFDLSAPPLLRAGLLQMPDRHLLMVDMPHIISDGFSMEILIRDFSAFVAHRTLEPLKLHYTDFTIWRGSRTEQERLKAQASFWKERFTEHGELPVLDLPLDFPRPKVRDFQGRRFSFELSPEHTAQLRTLANDQGVTLYILLLAIFNVFLSKITGQDRIVVGTAVAGRSHADLETLIGMFVNTLALLNSPEPDRSFTGFLEEVADHALEAFENQDYPFEDLVEEIDAERDTSRNPVFDVMFALQNMSVQQIDLPGLTVTPYPYETETSKFDLMFQVVETNTHLLLSFEYAGKLFREDTIRRFSRFFKRVVAGVLDNPLETLDRITITSREEREEILNKFNDTSVQYPGDRSIHDLFTEDARKYPDRAAAGFMDRLLTYGELDRLSDVLASQLVQRGVTPGTPVPILLKASIETAAGILGILKAQCAYMPIDPNYPDVRIRYMLNDSASPVLITNRQSLDPAKPLNIPGSEVIFIDDLFSSPQQRTTTAPPVSSSPTLAYVMYTSGSTGTPKGVMVEHRSVVRLVRNTNFVDFHPGDRIMQTGALEFDASTFEIWGALLNRLTLFLAPKEQLIDTAQLGILLAKHDISTIWLTAPLFNQVVQSGPHVFAPLRNLLVGGDVLSPPHIEEARSRFPGLNIINGYGPTENTTFSATFKIEQYYPHSIPIGTPIANSTMHIVDQSGALQPVGIAGEILVGGHGVARGYLNNPELTKEKFGLAHSSKLIARREEKEEELTGTNEPSFPTSYELPATSFIYKTGDRGRWLPDGNIQFFGRIDQQVKIRGFRIEPGEIEARLLARDDIREALVMPRDDSQGNKYLCAYIGSDEPPAVPELKQFLSADLPAYMIPSYFVTLDKFPLTPNGKVDRRQLPEPVADAVSDYAAPRDEVEQQLADAWAAVLEIGGGQTGIDDDFFEIGGHSLNATLLVSNIQKQLDVEINLIDIFTFPTVRELAAHIKQLNPAVLSSARRIIEPCGKREYYPVSSAQQRLFVLQQIDDTGTGYNIPSVLQLTGQLDIHRVERTFKRLIERHESLRTSFIMVDKAPVQRVHDVVPFQVQQLTVDTGAGASWDSELIEDFIRPFDLSNAPLMRAGLAEFPGEPGKHLLIVDMHHIISDGASMKVFAKDFIALYHLEDLTPLNVQYKDVAVWQLSDLQKERVQRQAEFWAGQFDGEIPVLNLPLDFPRPAVQRFDGSTVSFEIGSRRTHDLKALARSEGATLYIVLLAVYNVFLSRISLSEDIVVGSPVAGRSAAAHELEPIIGMFVNTLALRNAPDSRLTFRQFLRNTRERTLQAFENQDFPYEELVSRLDLERDAGRNPLFDVMFALHNIDAPELEIPGLTLTDYGYDPGVSKFDLTLQAVETSHTLDMTFEYATRLFNRDTVERFARYFNTAVTHLLDDPDTTLSTVGIIPGEEKQRVMDVFNRTSVDFPRDKNLCQLFEEQVERTPDHIAVVGKTNGGPDTVQLSYQELNRAANRVAAAVSARRNGCLTAVIMERTLYLPAVLLGILKTGSAYLPLDPGLPQERIEYILADSCASLLVTTVSDREAGFPGNWPGHTLHLDHTDFRTGEPGPFEASPVSPGSPAYVIYTSGTTGVPKGVLVEHRSVVNVVSWYGRTFSVKPRVRILQTAEYTFDASVEQVFGSLLHGASLHIITRTLVMDIPALRRYIRQYAVNVIDFVPMVHNELLGGQEKIPGLDVVISGSDRLDEAVKNKILAKGYNLYNLYGPTETTVDALYSKCSEERVNLGTPVDNTQCFILNPYGGLQPPCIPGELAIAGAGVARGYLNNPELTNERFILAHSSWLIARREEKEKKLTGTNEPSFPTSYQLPATSFLYKTGDLARWLPNGHIEFLGRIDDQVKIRGFRIEPGEIQSCLEAHRDIKEAFITSIKDKDGETALCAYYVLKEGASVAVNELLDYFALHLPHYMVPSYFVQLEKMPMNAAGKVDRRKLPQPDAPVGEMYVAPANEVEEQMVEIWQEVLGLDNARIGVKDNFFRLGGHSLKATVLTAAVRGRLGVDIPLSRLFESPTIRELSKFIVPAETGSAIAIEPSEEKEHYVLSSAQKRLYFLQQMDPKATSYNMPGISRVEGEPDKKRVRRAFDKLIQRQKSLRTAFHMAGDQVVQVIVPEPGFTVQYHKADTPDVDVQLEMKRFIRPFDLSEAPLLRVRFVELQPRTHLLMLDMHHIISDGISLGLFVNDFMAFYNGGDLPPLAAQYIDFAQWQDREKNKKTLQKQEEWWLGLYEGKVPVLNLPTDYARPALQVFEGRRVEFSVSLEETEALNALARDRDATLYMVLLSVYSILLSKLTGQQDMVIGAPTAGRPYMEVQKLIGMFLNTLALRTKPGSGKTFGAFLDEVKTLVLGAFENQQYQFEELVDRLDVPRDTGRNPMFDVMFILQNLEAPEISIPGLKLVPLEYEYTSSKFDLALYAEETENGLVFRVNYNSRLFKTATIDIFIQYFKALISSVIQGAALPLSQIEVFPGERRAAFLSHLSQELTTEVEDIMGDNLLQTKLAQIIEKYPDRTALEYGDRFVSYRMLDLQSETAFTRLWAHGVRNRMFVGVLMDDRIDVIAAMLGIIKAGCVAVLMYPGYPIERIEDMIRATDLRYLFIDERNQSRFPLPEEDKENLLDNMVLLHNRDCIPALPHEKAAAAKDRELAAKGFSPNDPMYIHFTSGTTGKPKAILGRNKGLLHFISWEIDEFGIERVFRSAQFTIPGFDPFLRDVFAPVLCGGTVCIPEDKDIVTRAADMAAWVDKHQISLIHCVTGLFRLLSSQLTTAKQFKGLKLFLLAGEKTDPSDLVHWYNILGGRVLLVNCYGPTETTMSKAFYPIEPADINRQRIPIGQPLRGARIIILDENREICGPLEPGEICIRTPYRSCGYHGAPDLNEDKFIPNPFNDDPDDIIYRSGDLGQFLPDGSIDILGRIDRQVKIRGYRVELEEIEGALVKDTVVKEAVVIKRGLSTELEFICAYITLTESGAASESDHVLLANRLKSELSRTLPDYMVPSNIVVMKKFPRKATGKVDFHQLPDPLQDTGKDYTPPENEIEEKLIRLWSEILKLDNIGTTDRFFELGGNSLIVMTLTARIHKEFNVRVEVADIFKAPTIRQLGKLIQELARDRFANVETVEDREYYPLSSSQKRFYVLQRLEAAGTAYHIPVAVQIDGPVDIHKTEQVFRALIDRHEALRTSFPIVSGQAVQMIAPVGSVSFRIEQIQAGPGEDGVTEAIHQFIRSFDLAQAPLMRVGLIRTAEPGRSILVADVHHIVSDGLSMNILMKEFIQLYKGAQLPGLRARYRDFTHWQEQLLHSGEMKKQERFWLDLYKGDLPTLQMPLDFPRPQVKRFEGDIIRLDIGDELAAKVKDFDKTTGTTMFITLLTTCYILLHKYSGQTDIIVGSPISGRRHADVENIMGVFINMISYRNNPTPGKTIEAFMEEVKTNAFQSYSNQDYQFDDLVNRLSLKGETGRNPLFDVGFVQNITGSAGADDFQVEGTMGDATTISPYEFGHRGARFDLLFGGYEADGKIGVSIEYSTQLFKPGSVELIGKHFIDILRQVVDNSQLTLEEITLSSNLQTAAPAAVDLDFDF